MSSSVETTTDGTSVAVVKPMRVSRANKQYLYSEEGHEYLDCLNGTTAHVGHAHPHVVTAGQTQMERLTTSQGYVSEKTTEFVKLLASIMPHELNVVYMCNSEAEACDLAIRIARKVSGNFDMVTMQDSYFGNLTATLEISPSIYGSSATCKKMPYVHVLQAPQMGHDQTDEDQIEAEIENCISNSEKQIDEAAAASGGLAGFLCDTMLVSSGVRLLSKSYFERLFKCVRQNGGLCIADETTAGLGRRGSHMWSFQRVGVIPDIVTVGRSLGNGHPIGAVICSNQTAKSMDGYYSTYGGNPVSCSMGIAVVRVLQNEKLISSAHHVGILLKSSLANLKEKHSDVIGEFRGEGLIWAIDIVNRKCPYQPDPCLTKKLVCHLKSKSRVIIGVTGGTEKSTLLFTPPMCFTVDNVRRFCQAFDEAISHVKQNDAKRSRSSNDDEESPSVAKKAK